MGMPKTGTRGQSARKTKRVGASGALGAGGEGRPPKPASAATDLQPLHAHTTSTVLPVPGQCSLLGCHRVGPHTTAKTDCNSETAPEVRRPPDRHLASRRVSHGTPSWSHSGVHGRNANWDCPLRSRISSGAPHTGVTRMLRQHGSTGTSTRHKSFTSEGSTRPPSMMDAVVRIKDSQHDQVANA